MKRFAMVLTLMLALAAGFGCAKKSSGSDPNMGDAGMSPEMRAAVQQITDGRVFFAFDKFDIKPEYKDMLKQKAELMKRFPTIRVRIEGNCDARGTQEYNLALGERRARAAYEYMVMLGVNPGQLEMISFGKERPLVEGTGESVWSKNRRDEFRVVGN
ncbi:MAG: peptidoglycan-associated lipoprotein Pal [Desulfovibrionaceae bacterium]